ncbi:heme ABC transporter ATP-binding protein [Nitrospina watsonii]|uniref:Vitamin B12 import system, ATPase component BtuD n=1 Tax=Nitrospina watsonii TaxID=1323948 RepID=A0ABN8W2Z1_9BACT|nr:heme ABC transporter ATP-binding protein [Nitrospina watsonii]CAI2718581.1 Putative Vitamin B12 import system, ATPase component BtuD [Nitrospina watsonii]
MNADTTLPTTAATQPLLRAENISFAYDRDLVVQEVSLDIQAGEFAGIIGPNGSGKSTLLKLMAGILEPDTRNVLFRGTDIKTCPRKKLAQSIAWIPQEHHMPFPFKVSEVVMMGRHPYLSAFTFEGDSDYEIVQHALEQTQTAAFAERHFNEISGGEKQRVMLASAIAQQPEAMLLDEPTSALDLKYQVELLKILKDLNTTRGVTIAVAMHDLHLASKYCRRLVLLKEGRVIKDGTPEDVLQKDILERVYEVKVKIFRDDTDGSFMISPEAS